MYVIDVDGTLANNEHRQHHLRKTPKDWKSFHLEAVNDTPFVPMFDVMASLHNSGFKVIVVTGREETYRDITLEFIQKYAGFTFDPADLFMRADKDYRDDTVVKEEIIRYVSATRGWSVNGIFEDRTRVVEHWRKIGWYVFNVNQTGEDF